MGGVSWGPETEHVGNFSCSPVQRESALRGDFSASIFVAFEVVLGVFAKHFKFQLYTLQSPMFISHSPYVYHQPNCCFCFRRVPFAFIIITKLVQQIFPFMFGSLHGIWRCKLCVNRHQLLFQWGLQFKSNYNKCLEIISIPSVNII